MSLLSTLSAVLMVGHSLIGPDQPGMLEQLLQAGGADTRVEAQIINGAPLKWNWDHSAEAEGVDARAALPGGTDALILTEAIPLANHLQWSDSTGYAARFADLARQGNPEVRVFVLETWHSLNSGTGVDVPHDTGAATPWRDRIADDLPLWQDLAEAAGATLVPAGQAMGQLSDAIAAGEAPGLGDIGDLFDDDIHPNDLGHYFVALVSYAMLSGQDPTGLPHRLRGRHDRALVSADPALIARMQGIATEVARNVTPAQEARRTPQPTAPPQPAPPARQGDMAVNLAAITDWSVQLPFLDLMKTARPWIGHRPGQWGGVETAALRDSGLLDENGWPTRLPRDLGSIGTLILTDLPEDAAGAAGSYLLRFQGKGIVEVSGRARNQRYGKNAVTFDFTPGPGPVEIRIQRTDPADPVRAITVVRADRVADFDAGALFNPDWLALLDGFRVLRFMDWMATNNSTQVHWQDRPRPGDYTYAEKGVPVEVLIALANRLKADPWFTLPHMADDAYVRAFGEAVRAGLAPDRQVIAEYSNEVWNWQFDQAKWAREQAAARWSEPDAGHQFYGMRAAEVANIWSSILPEDRLINVIATQTGWLGLEEAILTAPLSVAEGNARPADAFDAYAITGYFGGILGTEARAPLLRGWLAEGEATALAAKELRDGSVTGDATDTLSDLLNRVLPHHKAVADRYGLRLVMYEGGTHLTGIGPMADDAALSDFFIRFNYSPEMGALYRDLIAGWYALGGEMFNVFNDVYAPTKWGSWGARRHLGDDNPRWQAIEAAR
ncbi:SGNH/GDSL hydrolase family protein [Oceaniglobus trochenteri]|uniref:SGNH/GDSL hydrolase family protein n=1 Tax=Oceaniglobus trochenteri TaxID=2763260 RepID=UPI001CFFED99|nr:SGNH/GDSL hydrolase family protein [Oceaniglobus trochenteri]